MDGKKNARTVAAERTVARNNRLCTGGNPLLVFLPTNCDLVAIPYHVQN
jgi:hypothetical protein